MKLAVRLILAMSALVCLTAAVVGLLGYRQIRGHLEAEALHSMEYRCSADAALLQEFTEDVRRDLLAISRGSSVKQALWHLADSSTADREAALTELGQTLLAHLSIKPEYLQFRLIAAADNGRELVRAERSSVEGPARLVPEDELQEKGSRDYFINTMQVADGEVYVSPIDLNVEHGVIEDPPVPVMRFGTPLFSASGERLGILIINLDLRPVFRALRESTPAGWSVYLANADGNYLLNPDPALEFGFQRGRPRQLLNDFPELETLLPGGSAMLDSDRQGQLGACLLPLTLAEKIPLEICVSAPATLLLQPLYQLRSDLLLGTLACVLPALLLAILLARGLSGPLERITRSIRSYEPGRTVELPQGLQGEAGMLAQAFAELITAVDAGTAALHQEIAQRGLAEEQASRFAEEMRYFHELVESSSEVILTKDLQGVILSWNPAAELLYGYSAAEAVGQHISMIVPEGRRAEINGILERVSSGEPVRSVETIRRRRDGSLVEIRLTVSPVQDAAGRIIGASAISHDISEEKFSRDLFRLVVEASPSGILLSDEQGRIELCNGTVDRMFGYEAGSLQGRAVEVLVPEAARGMHPQLRQGYMQAARTRLMGAGRDLSGLRRDGSLFPIEIGLNPVQTSRGRFVLAVIIDITERKRNEEELKQKNVELLRSNQDLEQFAYIASHDLKEPLRMVASYTELLGERYRGQLDERADKYINYAMEGALRMQQLISDLLAFSRISSRPFDIGQVNMLEVLEQAQVQLGMAIRENAAEISHGELPTVNGNETLLVQLLQNLLGNAIKFRRADLTPRVHVSARPLEQRWEFSVEDNGLGIDPRNAERIFQMFQRLHERGRYEGSGIGLTISRKIVERHGGRIWFEAAAGGGTIFRFTI